MVQAVGGSSPSLTFRNALENDDFWDSARAPRRREGTIKGAKLCSIQCLIRDTRRSRPNDAPHRQVAKDAAKRYDDRIAQHRSHRAMVAISIAAKFVEQLGPDDRDLAWLRYLDAQDGCVELCESSRELLSRSDGSGFMAPWAAGGEPGAKPVAPHGRS